MIEFLQAVDIRLLYIINNALSNPVFDFLMPFLRQKLTWVPLYFLLIFFIVKRYGIKSIWVIAFALVSVLLADKISSGLIKPHYHRIRPCNNLLLEYWLKLPMGKGSGWSFVSSHAANHFALAIYFIMIFINNTNRLKVVTLFLSWAGLVAYAQVYIGFHYPSDVVAGGILGGLIGLVMGNLNARVLKNRQELRF